MPKTIVILLDGTSNEIARNRTHILRLYGCLEKDQEQLVYYDPGVGTFGAEHSPSYVFRKTLEVWGLVTGWGLDQNVKEAYRFLVDNYSHGDPDKGIAADRIVLAGFSRGAYSARVLAGLLHVLGLMRAENMNLLDYAYRAYKRILDGQQDTGERTLKDNPFAAVRVFDRMFNAPKVSVDLLLLFDTVGSMIEWDRWRPRIRRYAFTTANPSVKAVRHAVAIDEKRSMFEPVIWPKGQVHQPMGFNQGVPAVPQDVAEVWFSGVHGDVGGGVAENRSGLGKIALQWMIAEAGPLGVRFNQDTVRRIVLNEIGSGYEAPNPLASKNMSMTWAFLEILPRWSRDAFGRRSGGVFGLFLPMGRPREIPSGAQIHPSVFERKGTEHDFDQPNLPDRPA